MKFSSYGYRINPIIEGPGYTWIFLPGGPGLGSEYLIDFCKTLRLPGSIYLIDYPCDGTNTQGQLGMAYWNKGFMDLLDLYPNALLVTHSFSGMYVLSMPEIESRISGLILMNTSTSNELFPHLSAMQRQHGLPDLVPSACEYHLNPTNASYKQFWQAYKFYCFTPEELEEGEKVLEHFAFNNAAYYEAVEHFYPYYSYKWHPTQIPAMTISSERDFICEPNTFIDNPLFHSKMIRNKIIPNAGHVPWIHNCGIIQEYFDEFISMLACGN